MLLHAGNIDGFANVLFKSGAFGVEFFFIVSGYLMMAGIDKLHSSDSMKLGQETLLYIKRKVSQIYPEIVISWIFSIVIYVIAGNLNIRETLNLLICSLGDLLLVKSTGLNLGSVNGVVWYISSMLLVMIVMYPLIRKYRDVMLHIVLPVTALLSFGWLCNEAGTLRKPDQWLGWFCRGTPRAYAEIAIGVLCYPLSQKLAQISLTTFGKFLCSCVESGIYLCVILFTHFGTSSAKDYFYVLIMAVAIVITFSHQSLGASLFDHAFFYRLGKLSLPIYLSHAAWCKKIDALVHASTPINHRVMLYLLCSIVTAFLLAGIAKLWRRISPILLQKIKHLIIFESIGKEL